MGSILKNGCSERRKEAVKECVSGTKVARRPRPWFILPPIQASLVKLHQAVVALDYLPTNSSIPSHQHRSTYNHVYFLMPLSFRLQESESHLAGGPHTAVKPRPSTRRRGRTLFFYLLVRHLAILECYYIICMPYNVSTCLYNTQTSTVYNGFDQILLIYFR